MAKYSAVLSVETFVNGVRTDLAKIGKSKSLIDLEGNIDRFIKKMIYYESISPITVTIVETVGAVAAVDVSKFPRMVARQKQLIDEFTLQILNAGDAAYKSWYTASDPKVGVANAQRVKAAAVHFQASINHFLRLAMTVSRGNRERAARSMVRRPNRVTRRFN
jgi:hypothetical protein